MDDTDGLNKQVTEDDVMNMNGQSADDSLDESHKIMSWMHQLMSQGNQVVETTPEHSQNLLTASDAVNLTGKKLKAHTKGTTGNTMMEKSLLWVPC